ncbi:MAG: hypothetical protein F6J93_24755 [Oscillatoria sp. SIO1A7]|nr:hypothetical protein [Oscillatoria sp. SIO1A7]
MLDKIINTAVERMTREAEISTSLSQTAAIAIRILSDVPGMTQASSRDFASARPVFTLKDGTIVRTWKNPVGVDHIFLADAYGRMVFAGYVGWIDSEDLKEAIKRIKRELV